MWTRLLSFSGVALVAALLGTVVQAILALRTLRAQEPLARSAIAIYDLKREVQWWHPIRRLRHRRALRRALQESPVEASAYRRVWWALISWSALATGALMALVGQVTGT